MALVAVPYGTVEPWWQALFECTVFGLAALWLIEGFLNGSYDYSAYRILLPLVALALLGLIQTFPISSEEPWLGTGARAWQTLSADPHGTRLWVARMLSLVLMAAMLLRYTSSPRRLRLLIYVVIGIAVASALFGLARKTTQHEVGFLLPHLMPGFGYGQFINNNHFAFLIEMALGLLLGLAIASGVRRDRLPIYLGLILLLGMSLVLSNSRGGILAMLCQIVFVVILFPTVRSRRRDHLPAHGASKWVQQVGGSLVVRVLLIVCLIFMVSIGIVWVGGDSLLGRLEVIPSEVSTRDGGSRWGDRRIDIWRATWQLVKAHPIAGVGMGGYWTAIPEYHDASGEMTPQRAHNDYLELLASGGVIGVALSIWFIVGLIGPLRKRLRSTDRFRRAATYGALIGFSGVAVHSVVDFGLHITVNAVVCIALLIIATVDVPHEKVMTAPRS